MVPGVLPTGKVTFLFTDVEGSSQLWQDHPRGMADSLARHDPVLQNLAEIELSARENRKI
jgi:class 3 adenylate cyclase